MLRKLRRGIVKAWVAEGELAIGATLDLRAKRLLTDLEVFVFLSGVTSLFEC